MPSEIVAIPKLPFLPWKMEFAPSVYVSQTEARVTERAQIGDGFWELEASTARLLPAQWLQAEAWADQVISGSVFEAYHWYNRRPLSYGATPISGIKAGGGAFDGTANLRVITSALQIDVDGLPSGFSVQAGNLLEVRKSPMVRSLHRIKADAMATAGGILTVDLINPLATIFSANDDVVFEKPSCLMAIDSRTVNRDWRQRTLSFSAKEVLFSS